jgi:FMN reductase
MDERTIAVISAGLSTPSSTRLLADRLATATAAALHERGVESRVQVVELREHARALADRLVTGFADPALQEALDVVAGADGVIAVTPVFTASYSGLFKTFVDVLEPDALDGRPVVVAATAGTARHSLVLDHALRPLFTYLRAVVAPTGVFAAADDWGETGLAERITRAANELADLVAARPAVEVADPFAAATSFTELLSGHR